MNEVHCLGEVIDIGKFKFIYGRNLPYKSVINMEVKLVDGQIITARGYDEIADDILRNEFKFVYIYGQLRTDGYVQIRQIKNI